MVTGRFQALSPHGSQDHGPLQGLQGSGDCRAREATAIVKSDFEAGNVSSQHWCMNETGIYIYSRLVICVCKFCKLCSIFRMYSTARNSLYKYIFHVDGLPSIAKHVGNTEIDCVCHGGHEFKQREKNDFAYGQQSLGREFPYRSKRTLTRGQSMAFHSKRTSFCVLL